MGPYGQPQAQSGGGDSDVLAEFERRLTGLGDQAFTMPGAQLFEHLGVIQQTDPVALQEFDGLTPEGKAEVLMDALENPFWNLRESLTPQGHEPWTQEDRGANAQPPAPADAMLAAMGAQAQQPDIARMMMPRGTA